MGRGGWDADYNEEAHKLFARLKQRESRYRIPHDADIVYEHPSGAKFFIGNESIASNKDELLQRGITRIVNCQEPTARNFHEADGRFEYLRFPIAFWKRSPETATPEGLLQYMQQGLFNWVDRRLSEGHNVMVHCLAGAHRAGTSGVAYVMHARGLDFQTALREVQEKREIVDPIFDFKMLLEMLEFALAARRAGARQVDGARHVHPVEARGAHSVGVRHGQPAEGRGGYLLDAQQLHPTLQRRPIQAQVPHAYSFGGDVGAGMAGRRPVSRGSVGSVPVTAHRRQPAAVIPVAGRISGRSPPVVRTFRA